MRKRYWLIERRKELYASQAEFAKAIGISFSLYSKCETGERRPSPETAKKIAELLGIDWTRFYDDTEPTGEQKRIVRTAGPGG